MKTSKRSLAIVCGNAGVGKTTYGMRLARERKALLLDIDTVSEDLVRAGLLAMGHDPNDRDSPRYKEVFRDAIHDTLFSIAADNLDHLACVIVAPFTKERRDPTFKGRIEAQLDTTLEVFYLWCDESLRRRRIEVRGNPRDRAKLEAWDTYSEAGRDPAPPPFDHVFVNTSVTDD